MQVSINNEIGIREIRQLTSFVKEKHGVDYSEYALTSFKRRVEGFMSINKYSMDTLLRKLESKVFLDHFMGRIAVSDTELFRDPTFWILLKNIYIANIIKEHSKVKVWLPLCASGEEYYSLVILLRESGWSNCSEIYLSCMSNETLQNIKHGWLENEKLEISSKNYSRLQGASQLSDYFKMTDQEIAFDQSLFANTKFFKGEFVFDPDLPYMHLILFRNKFIYFTPSLQYKVSAILYNRLTARGLLATGLMEEVESSKFTVLNKDESIFQRKN